MNVVHTSHPHPLRAAAARLPRSGLLLLTSLCSIDGTMMMLAATGALSSLGGAVVAGLTVVAGVGSWLAARREFGGRRLTGEDALALTLVALVATVAATLSGVVAALLATGAWELAVLPRAGGVVLLLLALEIGGVRLPRIRGVPPTVALVAASVLLEGVVQWIR